MSKTEQFPGLEGKASPEQIEQWKKKHGQVFGILAGDHICYIRKPTRQEISYAQTVGQTNPMKSNEILLNACFLGGSEKFKTEDSFFFGASVKLSELITIEETEMINL